MRCLILCAVLAASSMAQSQQTLKPIEIQLVDEQDRAVAGAQIFALGNTPAGLEYTRLNRAEDDRDMVAIVTRMGARATTDARGSARVERREVGMFVAAMDGERMAFGTVDKDSAATVRLKLAPDQHIDIQVLDEAGAPRAQVPVALYRFSEHFPPSIYAPAACVWSRPTLGEQGMVRLAHAQHFLASPEGMTVSFELGLGIPLRAEQRIAIDPRSLPKQPIVLRMPATGSVKLKMAEAPESWARIRPLPANDGGMFSRGENTIWSNYSPTHATFVGGVAQFPFVEVGLELQVQAWWKDAVAPADFVRNGPTKAGEELVIEIDAQQGPGGLQVGEDDIVVLHGQTPLRPRTAFLTSSSFDNDRFTLCFVPDDMRSPGNVRSLNLRMGKQSPAASGWHSVDEGDQLGHFEFRGLDEPQAQLASKRFNVPIAKLGARPCELDAKFSLDKQSYAPREAVQLRLHVENLGPRSLVARFGGWHREANRHGRFEFKIVKDGVEVPDISRTSNRGGMAIATEIEPRAHFDEQAQLEQWCAFDAAGIYEVEARYELRIEDTPLDHVGGPPCPSLRDNVTDFIRGRVSVHVR